MAERERDANTGHFVRTGPAVTGNGTKPAESAGTTGGNTNPGGIPGATIPPAGAGNGNAAGSGYSGEKRGRKPGQKNGTGKASIASGGSEKSNQVHLEPNAISSLLFSCHAMLAGIVKCPELNLSEGEAKKLGEATCKVARHYPQLQMKEKSLDWYNLILCLSIVYGSRLMQISARRKKELNTKAEATQPA